MQVLVGSVCSRTDYKYSPFCRVCVTAQYYAISDSCTCQPLTLNADFCYMPSDDQATSAVQNAIDQANQACPSPAVPYEDAGASNSPSNTTQEAGAEAM
jgi:hypothetical protein